MNSLVAVNFDTHTVSARDLHEKLNIGTRFNDWFPRMAEYGFVEGIDFYSKLSKTENGGRPSTDYEISIDMAKHICMIQRTPEGKVCRQYLIDLEKAWNTPEQIMARALKLAQQTVDSLKERCRFLGGQVVEQQKVIEDLQPKASYYDLILQCPDLISTTVIAKDYGMSAKKFNSMDGDVWFENENSPDVKFMIRTLEGVHEAKVGDYIIRGIVGEIYPCKPDIFRATYEMVTDGRCESPNNPAIETLTNILFEECYEAANKAICQPEDRKNKHDGGSRIDAAAHSALLKVIAKAGLTDEWRKYSETAQKNT